MDVTFSSAPIVHRNVQENNLIEINMRDNSVILFVLSGRVSVSGIDFEQKIILSNEMLFLSPGIHYEVLAMDSSILAKYEFNRNVLMKMGQFLTPFIEEKHFDNQLKVTLPIKYSLMRFLEFFRQCDLNKQDLNEWCHDGLLLMLKNSYSKMELAALFFPVLGENMNFKEFVYANYNSVRSLQEFADLAKCSLSVFCREFKSNFGESAYQWILKRKSKYVLRDIISTSIPFQELADKYQFSSQAHFTKFCKQRYNMTPKDLRSNSRNCSFQNLAH